MSRHTLISLVLAVSLAACSAPVTSLDAPPAPRFDKSPSSPVHVVTVAGNLDLSMFGVTNERYAIVAQKDGSGNVQGRATVIGLNQTVNLHGDVTCLQVSGTLAWIGVTITESTDADGPLSAGGSFWFRVQDNGEGANAPADRISALNPAGGAARCNEMRTGLPLAWEMIGNVQVR